jgi:hypothetical protein
MYSVAYVIVSPSLPSTSIGMPLHIPATKRGDRKGGMVAILAVLAGGGYSVIVTEIFRLESPWKGWSARMLGKGGFMQESPV